MYVGYGVLDVPLLLISKQPPLRGVMNFLQLAIIKPHKEKKYNGRNNRRKI